MLRAKPSRTTLTRCRWPKKLKVSSPLKRRRQRHRHHAHSSSDIKVELDAAVSPCDAVIRVGEKMSDSAVSVHDVVHDKDDESVTVRAPVPKQLERGVPMLKISSKKLKQVVIKLDDGEISWAGKGHDG